MKIKVQDVPIIFKILYANKTTATVQECNKIERRVTQDIELELPAEVAGLLQNMKWSQTLGLWVEIKALNNIDLDTIIIKENPEKKGILERLGF